MRTRVYKLYVGSSSSTNNAASIIIQRAGLITAIVAVATADMVADNSQVIGELSFSSVIQSTTNDTLGPIAMVQGFGSLVTSGLVCPNLNSTTAGVAIAVSAGDRLYVNTTIVTAVLYATFFVFVAEA